MIYDVKFRADVLSGATENSGAGAAMVPGSSVVMKAGASEVEPVALAEDDDYYHMNIDIGTPAAGGDDMVALGNLHLGPNAIPEPEGAYALQTLQNDETPFTVKADENGSAWLIFGAEVGTPGQVAFYYSQLGARFTEAPPGEQ